MGRGLQRPSHNSKHKNFPQVLGHCFRAACIMSSGPLNRVATSIHTRLPRMLRPLLLLPRFLDPLLTSIHWPLSLCLLRHILVCLGIYTSHRQLVCKLVRIFNSRSFDLCRAMSKTDEKIWPTHQPSASLETLDPPHPFLSSLSLAPSEVWLCLL